MIDPGVERQIESTICYLNGLLQADRKAVSKLVHGRVRCNAALADHKDAQVAWDGPKHDAIGMLEVVNGLFGRCPDSCGPIAAVVNRASGLVECFERTHPDPVVMQVPGPLLPAWRS